MHVSVYLQEKLKVFLCFCFFYSVVVLSFVFFIYLFVSVFKHTLPIMKSDIKQIIQFVLFAYVVVFFLCVFFSFTWKYISGFWIRCMNPSIPLLNDTLKHFRKLFGGSLNEHAHVRFWCDLIFTYWTSLNSLNFYKHTHTHTTVYNVLSYVYVCVSEWERLSIALFLFLFRFL